MKSKIIAVCLGVFITFGLLGCGKEVVNVNGQVVSEMGQFIPIHEEYYYDDQGVNHKQYIVYDKETMVMYVVDNRYYGTSMAPYYVVDEYGNAAIGIYNGDMEW